MMFFYLYYSSLGQKCVTRWQRNITLLPLTVMSQSTDRARWTIQDVAALPDNEWIRYEIIDGELLVT
ncbi:hypothetical protein [Calothrix rhizosoleniae]|uniref:hypothetical protein n=1 Tax=Calothrix rhizosoleniae TaxID=888997 RepID=UPI0030D906AE